MAQVKDQSTIKSAMLKAGKKTYFFDIKVASNAKRYLKVTESSFEGEGNPRKYNSFVMFPETVETFQQRLSEIAKFLAV